MWEVHNEGPNSVKQVHNSVKQGPKLSKTVNNSVKQGPKLSKTSVKQVLNQSNGRLNQPQDYKPVYNQPGTHKPAVF